MGTRKNPPRARDVVVLIHVDSLDSYAAEVSRFSAQALREAMVLEVRENARVIVVTQAWGSPMGSAVVEAAMKAKRTVIHFDEDTDDWGEFGVTLVRLVKKMKPGTVYVGGVWATEHGEWGCVNEAEKILLAAGLKAEIDPDLCGWEDADA